MFTKGLFSSKLGYIGIILKFYSYFIWGKKMIFNKFLAKSFLCRISDKLNERTW